MENSNCLKSIVEKLQVNVLRTVDLIKQLARDDPRRVMHSFKVGLAITLVSMFYYFEPLYQGFGVNAMWTVLTVVMVFEFSAGATLGRGVNRGIATIIGGMLGVGAHRLANLPGSKIEPVLLALFVFLLAGVMTFARFVPKLKARYDYGLMMFILTFCLISVSGYRDDEVIDMTHRRISTILIGSTTAVIICIFICPVWAGCELHLLVASNLDKLAKFLQEFGEDYFDNSSEQGGVSQDKKELMEGFKSVLNSKNTEDSLVNNARWEPRHGRFKYMHPWQQYQKIGGLTRCCASRIEALHGFLSSHSQAPTEVKSKLKEPCTKMSLECGQALKELSLAIKKMNYPLSTKCHIRNSKQAAQQLNSFMSMSLWKDHGFAEVMPVAAVASLLLDITSFVEKIEEAVQDLASLAKFKTRSTKTVSVKSSKLSDQGPEKQCSFANHVIVITESSSSPRCSKSFKDPPSSSVAQQGGE